MPYNCKLLVSNIVTCSYNHLLKKQYNQVQIICIW